MSQIQLLQKYGIRLKKALGQHFLVDENIQHKIVNSLELERGDRVLEIGAGMGAITKGLLDSGAWVCAVEKDPTFTEILQTELGHYENLRILNQNILRFDFEKELKEFPEKDRKAKWKVAGNLPYYITTHILIYLLENKAFIDSAVLMIQKEVAERILAQPGSKTYGRLTLAVRFHADVEWVMDVGRKCFRPIPEVDSAVIRLKFHKQDVPDLDEKLLFQIIHASFATRRKNILNCLSASPFDLEKAVWKEMLDDLGIPVNTRAEELLLKDFIRITFSVKEKIS